MPAEVKRVQHRGCTGASDGDRLLQIFISLINALGSIRFGHPHFKVVDAAGYAFLIGFGFNKVFFLELVGSFAKLYGKAFESCFLLSQLFNYLIPFLQLLDNLFILQILLFKLFVKFSSFSMSLLNNDCIFSNSFL